MSNRFHMAIKAGDLDIAKEFYCGLLGCEQGKEEINPFDSWVDINFWDNELTLHASTTKTDNELHHVDCGDVGVPHFGVHLSGEEFAALKAKLIEQGTPFLNPPFVRFVGGDQEMETMFIADPNGNVLEIKTMKNPNAMWEFVD